MLALESNPTLPGVVTRCATIHQVADINGDGLVEALEKLAGRLDLAQRPVLFLSNDRMVETIGRQVARIKAHYRLSWANSSAELLPLLRKDQIAARCVETGLAYPATRIVDSVDDLPTAVAGLRFPLIFKPTVPISAFKTLVADSASALSGMTAQLEGSLPVVVQEFIAGGDEDIRFGALYLQQGEVLARFEGRKLRSRPMGHTTVAVSEPSDIVHEQAMRFFSGLQLSGPVSLELKRDPEGVDWVIEPTVGRSDFWIGLCIENGVDLPLIEHRATTGASLPSAFQGNRCLWINGERDPAALFWLAATSPGHLFRYKIRGVYADRRDPQPRRRALRSWLAALPRRVQRKATKHLLR